MQNSVTSLTRIFALVLLLCVTMVHGQGKKSDQDTRESELLGFQAMLRAVDHPEKALERVKSEIRKIDSDQSADLRIAPRLVSLLGMLKTPDSKAYLRELAKRDENDPIRVIAYPLAN